MKKGVSAPRFAFARSSCVFVPTQHWLWTSTVRKEHELIIFGRGRDQKVPGRTQTPMVSPYCIKEALKHVAKTSLWTVRVVLLLSLTGAGDAAQEGATAAGEGGLLWNTREHLPVLSFLVGPIRPVFVFLPGGS